MGGVGWKRRIRMIVPTRAHCRCGLEQMRIGPRGFSAGLPQRRQVVENPKRASIRGRNQIIVMHSKITHGHYRQIELQRCPVLTSVERHVHTCFSARVNQSFACRIFAHDASDACVRQAGNDLLPGLARVVRSKDVRMRIVAR